MLQKKDIEINIVNNDIKAFAGGSARPWAAGRGTS